MEAAAPLPGPDLPEDVWTRLVALAAEVLPAVDPLPMPLRRLAHFAPSRRARLGSTPISLALARDDDFRALVADQVVEQIRRLLGEDGPTLLDAVLAGGVPAGVEPAEVAAITWLLRPDGWPDALAGLLDRVEDRTAVARRTEHEAEVGRLREALAEAESTQREQRARSREQLDVLKAENAALRHRLGESRVATRAAQAASADARAAADASTATAATAAAAAEGEMRRLRARVGELEEAAGAGRREGRAQRDETSLRARLLLDVLLDAGQGLRRELALPSVDGAPADRLEEELRATAADAAPADGAPASAAPVSATQLEAWLQLPKARLLVDGYNVSKSAWPESSLDVQRTRLVGAMAALVARTGAETTVVFDAAGSGSRPLVHPPRGVKVLFSPPGVIADDVLRDLVAVEPPGRVVVVVSSDGEVMRDVRRAGARAVPSPVLLALLSR